MKISIPNQYYDSSMQVFKGIETDSAVINWVDPLPTDTTPQSAKWWAGKTLFESKCATCHHIFGARTGPALQDVEDRIPDRKTIYDYIHNPPAIMAKSSYFRNLKSRFGSEMTPFPVLSNESIDAILDYIKNESKGSGAVEEEEKYEDSLGIIERPCGNDTFYLPVPKNNLTFLDTLSNDPPEVFDTTPVSNEPAIAEESEGPGSSFNDPNPTDGMYDFEIKGFGWFNVDAYVKEYDETINVKLSAKTVVDLNIYLDVYLFCPEKKILIASYDKKGNTYSFNTTDEGIPLFLNDRAILFAVGSNRDQMYYGISEFKIQAEQTITINVKETTEEEIRKALLSKQLDGIDLGIEKKERKIILQSCDDLLPKADSTRAIFL